MGYDQSAFVAWGIPISVDSKEYEKLSKWMDDNGDAFEMFDEYITIIPYGCDEWYMLAIAQSVQSVDEHDEIPHKPIPKPIVKPKWIAKLKEACQEIGIKPKSGRWWVCYCLQ